MSHATRHARAKDLVLVDALTRARTLASRKSPAALYELQSAVSRLAANRRLEDPEHAARFLAGSAAARPKIHVPPRFAEARP